MVDDNSANKQSLVTHLTELRWCLLKALTCTLFFFLAALYFANDIYRQIALPLIDKLPVGSSMIATEVASPFLTPIKLTFFFAIFVTMPYSLYQAWYFISPGLYKNERRVALPLLFTSIILFYVGSSFAYFIVLPLVFGFLVTVAPAGVMIMTDIQHYLNFIIKLFFAFGLAFEIPVATFILVRGGFISAERLQKSRAYIVLSAFILAMLLTPPDVVSQILLAVPMWLLFELGLLFSRYNPPG